jgi:L-lactate dehydrogenase complex protein LldG
MTTRDEFLEAVRRSTGGDQDAPVSTTSTAPAEPSATEVGRMDDQRPLADVFEDRAGEVGMHVHRVADMSAASDEVANILDSESIDRVLAWADRDVDGLEFRDGVEVERWDPSLPADDLKDSAFGMSCGVTGADYAVAETGSLVVCSSPEHGRSVSLLGRVHVALVRTSVILPDLYDLFARIKTDYPDGLPSNISLVTGPSKTADIELNLVIGVHGPATVHIVMVEA